MLLRESLAAGDCHATMIAHVSDEPARHAETLSTAQLAARIHRLRRRKAKVGARPAPPRRGSPRPCDLRGPMPRSHALWALGSAPAWPCPGEA